MSPRAATFDQLAAAVAAQARDRTPRDIGPNFLRGAPSGSAIQGAGPVWRSFVPSEDEIRRGNDRRETLDRLTWDRRGR